MKKSTLALFTILMVCFCLNAQAQKFPGPDPSPLDVAFYPNGVPTSDLRGGPKVDAKIKMYYSRPQLKGRDMIGGKDVPFGQLWRLGANEASEITFYEDVTFGTSKVKKGTYTIYAIPEKDKWTFVLHSKLNTWGNYSLKDSKEIARAEAKVSTSEETIEYLSVMFTEAENGANLLVGWQNTIAELPIKF